MEGIFYTTLPEDDLRENSDPGPHLAQQGYVLR